MSRYLKWVFSIGAGLMKHTLLCVYFFSLRGLSVKTVFCVYACVFSFKWYSLSSDTPLALRFAVIKKKTNTTKHLSEKQSFNFNSVWCAFPDLSEQKVTQVQNWVSLNGATVNLHWFWLFGQRFILSQCC